MILFGKDHCREQLSPEQNKEKLREMLDIFTAYCDEHHIRYFLSGGTLLGAVRHKGFIPWDDDVDINIPRPDIEKLYEISRGRIGDYRFVKPGENRYAINSQFYRLFNESYIIEEISGTAVNISKKYYPIGIDVFPIDGFPDNIHITKLYCKKLVFLRKMLGVSSYNKPIGKTFKTYLVHSFAFIPAKLVGKANWEKMFQRCAKKYDFDKSTYVGVTTTVHYITREKILKCDYLHTVNVEFEGRTYHAPGNYDVYLSQLYGNYMELPPAEKQVSDHNIRIFRRGD